MALHIRQTSAVFVVTIAAGDSIKCQSYVFGSFVWEIHVRYNKSICELTVVTYLPLTLVSQTITYQSRGTHHLMVGRRCKTPASG